MPRCVFQDDRVRLLKVSDLMIEGQRGWDVECVVQTFNPFDAGHILKNPNQAERNQRSSHLAWKSWWGDVCGGEKRVYWEERLSLNNWVFNKVRVAERIIVGKAVT
ncbi:protein kinase superfamily protein [Striga asiatica]|uniref:Protein kinase superfamily protein n=1 Tax=Striga asiatica TaxID=4170 RepID=A0A5A7PE73_STRAF|nr:protein kinase superfamily protein [Striga asiatica]